MTRNKTTYIICAVLLFLFLYTGAGKLLDTQTFRMALDRQPFARETSDVLAWVLPSLELAVALLLLPAPTRKAGLYLSFVLLLIFTMYTALVLSGYYRDTPCPCGGFISGLSWKEHLLFNLACLLLNGTAIALYTKTFKRPQLIAQPGEAEYL